MKPAARLAFLLVAGACTHNPPSSGEASPAAAPATNLQAPSASGATSAANGNPDGLLPAGDWVEAARSERWDEVARRIDALDDKTKNQPGARYVRARAALALGDAKTAVPLLDGLERSLGLLSADVERYRAEAELDAGPFEHAARYFEQGRAPSSLVKAALAFERAGQLDKARAAADRALSQAQKLDDKHAKPDVALEARARAVRARIAEQQGRTAAATSDLKWIVTFAPTAPDADGLDERLEKLAPGRGLTKNERFERALDMADHGLVERTDRELELLQKAPGPPVPEGEQLYARGWALYKARRDYLKSSELFEHAAKLGSRDVARDLFYAARARSRANDDEHAIEMYEALARRFPRTSWAEHASFLAARLRYVLAKWDDAARAYERYLAQHAKGQYDESGRYELAVAWLAAGKNDKAAKAFSQIAADGDPDRSAVANALELEAVAVARAGKKDAAVSKFRRVLKDHPLSFAALTSAARLGEIGEPLPPLIEPAKRETATPLDVHLPPRAALLVSLGLDRDAEQELALQAEMLRKRHAPRSDEALCRAYSKLATATERYRVAQQAARWSDLRTAPSPASRWLWECLYPKPYETVVREAEMKWKLPNDLVYAVMRQESAFRSSAVSAANAFGLMQLLEPTSMKLAREIGLGWNESLLISPPHNIRLGSYYLKKLLDDFGGQLALAAAAYNAGPLAVNRWLETGETLPLDLWVARIPYDETRTYVTRVIGNYARYAYLDGGETAVPKLALALPKGLRAPPDAF